MTPAAALFLSIVALFFSFVAFFAVLTVVGGEKKLRQRVEQAILILYKAGRISVEVRHVTEASKTCAACKGTGRDPAGPRSGSLGEASGHGPLFAKIMERSQFIIQGICLACEGSGRIR